MSCLKNITRSIFLTVFIAGFIALGGHNFLKNIVIDYFNPSQDKILERAKKVGDLSGINKEFEIEKAVGILGYNTVVAEHKASGQKMLIVDSGKKTLLTQEDITADDAEKRIKSAIEKFKYQAGTLEDFKITERGTMISYGHKVPYVRFSARLKKLPIGDIGGIISVARDDNGNDKILVSANKESKYSQLISNEFFKDVK